MSQEHVIALHLIATNFDVLQASDPKKTICNFSAEMARRKTLATSFLSSLSLQCVLRGSGCRIGYEPTKMSRDHFWRSISRDTNVEVSALSPLAVSTNKTRQFTGIVPKLLSLYKFIHFSNLSISNYLVDLTYL